MHGVNTEEWKDFFVAVSGAASALAGLVFVALSINLSRILEMPGLPARAGETIILLAAALLAALIALIPGQSTQVLGLALGAVGLIAWIVPLVLQIAAGRAKHIKRTAIRAA
jgi:modulator of FtsH protease